MDIMKKKAEKKNKNFEFGQVMSLLESMDGGIKVISEQHGDVMSKLKEHDQEFETIGSKLKEHDQKFETLEEKMDLMQDDITEIKHKLSEKVDREEFNKLEKRMVKLEKLVFAKV